MLPLIYTLHAEPPWTWTGSEWWHITHHQCAVEDQNAKCLSGRSGSMNLIKSTVPRELHPSHPHYHRPSLYLKLDRVAQHCSTWAGYFGGGPIALTAERGGEGMYMGGGRSVAVGCSSPLSPSPPKSFCRSSALVPVCGEMLTHLQPAFSPWRHRLDTGMSIISCS